MTGPDDFDPRRRAVWLGLTIPGKKMMRMIAEVEGYNLRERSENLDELYRDMPHTVMMKVAIALHYLPKHGVMGPGARDLIRRDLNPDQLFFGAILTDIRDFLKLRFRARGVTDVPMDAVLEGLQAAGFPDGVEPARPGRVINWVISALDAISKDREGKVDITAAVKRLRDLLRNTAREVDPGRLSSPSLAEQMDTFYDQLFREDSRPDGRDSSLRSE